MGRGRLCVLWYESDSHSSSSSMFTARCVELSPIGRKMWKVGGGAGGHKRIYSLNSSTSLAVPSFRKLTITHQHYPDVPLTELAANRPRNTGNRWLQLLLYSWGCAGLHENGAGWTALYGDARNCLTTDSGPQTDGRTDAVSTYAVLLLLRRERQRNWYQFFVFVAGLTL